MYTLFFMILLHKQLQNNHFEPFNASLPQNHSDYSLPTVNTIPVSHLLHLNTLVVSGLPTAEIYPSSQRGHLIFLPFLICFIRSKDLLIYIIVIFHE
nr:MAG TPA: hypothetical protein [Caudoviricetes sp.]